MKPDLFAHVEDAIEALQAAPFNERSMQLEVKLFSVEAEAVLAALQFYKEWLIDPTNDVDWLAAKIGMNDD